MQTTQVNAATKASKATSYPKIDAADREHGDEGPEESPSDVAEVMQLPKQRERGGKKESPRNQTLSLEISVLGPRAS
eukprot:2419279-Rhodomonas_salina.1